MDVLEDVDKLELEEQFILRVPEKNAKKLRKLLKKKPKIVKNMLSLELDVESCEGTLNISKKRLAAKLVDLPTITESCKTTDKVNLFKTANISQMLICNKMEKFYESSPREDGDEEDAKQYLYSYGMTPPLKNVKKCRFRKTLRNPNNVAEVEDVEKEVLLLLRADNEAVTSRFEIIYENEPNNNTVSAITEETIFGEMLSSGESDGSGASGLNDLMDFTN